jgi:hypothetical protein
VQMRTQKLVNFHCYWGIISTNVLELLEERSVSIFSIGYTTHQTPKPSHVTVFCNGNCDHREGRSDSTPRKLVTAISENCYQTELNTWKLGKRPCNSQNPEKLNSHATEQASHRTVALPRSFLVLGVLTRLWDSGFFRCFMWHERLMKLLIFFLCS